MLHSFFEREAGSLIGHEPRRYVVLHHALVPGHPLAWSLRRRRHRLRGGGPLRGGSSLQRRSIRCSRGSDGCRCVRRGAAGGLGTEEWWSWDRMIDVMVPFTDAGCELRYLPQAEEDHGAHPIKSTGWNCCAHLRTGGGAVCFGDLGQGV